MRASIAHADPFGDGRHDRSRDRGRYPRNGVRQRHHRLRRESDRSRQHHADLPRAAHDGDGEVAMFDAVNSIERRYRPYVAQLPVDPATSKVAAAAAALVDVRRQACTH